MSDDDELLTDRIVKFSTLAGKLIGDTLDFGDEHLTVEILQHVMISVISQTLYALHKKGDTLTSRESISQSCIMLLSAMAPGIDEGVIDVLAETLGLPPDPA